MGESRSIFSGISSFDAYAKTLEDFSIKTTSGGIVTLVSYACIFVLVISKTYELFTPTFKPQLNVDISINQPMQINLNMTFHHLPCFLLSMGLADASGRQQTDMDHDLHKTRIKGGKVVSKEKAEALGTVSTANKTDIQTSKQCGSCYGAEIRFPDGSQTCCESCKDVIIAYDRRGWKLEDLTHIDHCVREGLADKVRDQKEEGCQIDGQVSVPKVMGMFHVAAGLTFPDGTHLNFRDLDPFHEMTFDFSHTVQHLSFGPYHPLIVNPLDNYKKLAHSQHHLFNYHIKVVSTKFQYLNNSELLTNQYAVTEYDRDINPNEARASGKTRNNF
jgi:hypothetical protein